MATSNPASPDVAGDYAPTGFARRAAFALRRAGKVVWRGDGPPATDASTAVVTFAALTDRLKRYLSSSDIQRIKEAYRFSDAAHLGQFRKSGEPYITHPIAVAEVLVDWKLDAAAHFRGGLRYNQVQLP